jgi:lysophospholipase
LLQAVADSIADGPIPETRMNAVQPNGPSLVNLPSNPVPQGARVGMFWTSDRVNLRYALFPRTGPVHKGTVCLVQGRTEFIEKYFETIADFQRRGFAVATFDLRGQGGSDRLIRNGSLGFVERFDDYWTDLSSFHAEILLPDCPPPFYLVGHSMGGLVCLFAGARDRMMFDRILVASPMLAIDKQPLSMAGMAQLAETLSFFGLGKLPVGRAGDKPASKATFPGNVLTSDITRYLRAVDVLEARPELLVGSPTIRWTAAAMRAMAIAGDDAFPASMKAPVLMLAAARDEVVSPSAIEQLGLRLRTGRHLMIPGARHEMFMETDAIRGQVFAAFDAFITEQSA